MLYIFLGAPDVNQRSVCSGEKRSIERSATTKALPEVARVLMQASYGLQNLAAW